MLLWIVIGLLAVAVFIWLSRAGELFLVSVRDGKVLLVRGRISQAMLNDFAAAVQKPKVARGSIRAVREAHGAQLYAWGDLDEFQEQRLRNIFRIHPAASLRSAAPLARPTLGQLLGIAWLAWLLHRPE